MINLSDQTVGRRFAVGQIKYKLQDELWVYAAKDIHRSIGVSLLIPSPDSNFEKLDSFLDYLAKIGIKLVETAHFLNAQKTYRYSAIDITDRQQLENIYNDWLSGKPIPKVLPRTKIDQVPHKVKDKILETPTPPIYTKPKKQGSGWEKVKYLAIGGGSVLVLVTIALCVMSPYIIKVFTPTATPTPTFTFTPSPTATNTPTLTPSPTTTPTFTPTLTMTPILATDTITSTPYIFVLQADTYAQNLLTGESLIVPANTQIIILDAEYSVCQVLTEFNGTQVIISADLIFPEMVSICRK